MPLAPKRVPLSSLFFNYALLFHYAIIKSNNYESKKKQIFKLFNEVFFPCHKPFKHLPVTSTKELH